MSDSTKEKAENTFEDVSPADALTSEDGTTVAPANRSASPSAVDRSPSPVNRGEENMPADAENMPANTSTKVEGEEGLAEKMNMPVSETVKMKKARSEKALGLEAERRRIFEGDLKQAYTNAFGDDRKAPKPKFLEATALVKIRREQGEQAYKDKIQQYVARNQGKVKGVTKKNVPPPKSASHTRSKSKNTLLQSIHSMTEKVRENLSGIEKAASQLSKHADAPPVVKKTRKPRKKTSAVKLNA
ncbi:hypothetical protein EBR66_05775 [bacterium]|nr:hypothetical protein [bacterium]